MNVLNNSKRFQLKLIALVKDAFVKVLQAPSKTRPRQQTTWGTPASIKAPRKFQNAFRILFSTSFLTLFDPFWLFFDSFWCPAMPSESQQFRKTPLRGHFRPSFWRSHCSKRQRGSGWGPPTSSSNSRNGLKTEFARTNHEISWKKEQTNRKKLMTSI